MSHQPHFFNTIHERGRTLKDSLDQSLSQEVRILNFFYNTRKRWGASDVWEQVLPECQKSTVGRALSNLRDEGKIRKTRQMQMGKFGKHEHLWTLNKTI